VNVVSPFPRAAYPLAWGWLRQFPQHNFDDSGPRTVDEFAAEMDRRLASGERAWGFEHGGNLAGIAGYAPLAAHWGMFHGICFDERVHGKGIARAAIEAVLTELFAQGVEKISASYFAENTRIERFLARLGAIEEGYLHRQARRGGQPVDMRLVAFHREGI
jgi:RimJ/RimL family protein N-acetyltransferase